MLVFEFATMTADHVRDIVGKVKVVDAAILHHHHISFGGKSAMHQGSSVATVVPHKDKDVLGLVYDLNDKQLQLFTLFQECNTGLRKRVTKEVETPSGDTVQVVVFVHRETLPAVQPSEEYFYRHKTLVHESFENFHKKRFSPAQGGEDFKRKRN